MNQESRKKPISPVSLRLTAEERAVLEQAAAGQSISAFIRERVLGEQVRPRKARRQPVKDEEALAKVLGLLGQSRIAQNLKAPRL